MQLSYSLHKRIDHTRRAKEAGHSILNNLRQASDRGCNHAFTERLGL